MPSPPTEADRDTIRQAFDAWREGTEPFRPVEGWSPSDAEYGAWCGVTADAAIVLAVPTTAAAAWLAVDERGRRWH